MDWGSRFLGKNVIVTGGSSGIGLASARILAAAGANVVIAARSADQLVEARKELCGFKRNPGQQIEAVAIDVSDFEMVQQWAAAYEDHFTAPDIIINAAGIGSPGYFETLSSSAFEDTMSVNCGGVINVCRAFVPLMKSWGGHIVNVSSLAGLLGVFGNTSYCASKFAVIGFSQALRAEMKRYKINVSVICPPDTDTPLLARSQELMPPETRALSGSAGLLSSDRVARVLLKGMLRNRFIIIPGFSGKLVYWTSRFSPGLLEIMMDRAVKRSTEVEILSA